MKPMPLFKELQKTNTREDIIKALREFRKPQSLTLTIITESSPFTDELAKALDRLYKQRFSTFETPRAGNQPDDFIKMGDRT